MIDAKDDGREPRVHGVGERGDDRPDESNGGAVDGVAAFTGMADSYDAWFQSGLGAFVDAGEHAAFERLLEAAGVLPDAGGGAEVIEIGAGTGHVCQWLLARGFSVVAVEPSAAMR